MPDIEIQLRNKQKLLFTLTEEKLSEFMKPDGTPDSDKLISFAEKNAPQAFSDLRSYDSANRYRQGGSKPAPKAEPKPATKQPDVLPAPWKLPSAGMEAPKTSFTPEQVDAYRQRWFKTGTGGAGGSIPYKVLSEYLLAPDRKSFRFPAGFSTVGQAAVKAEADARMAAQRESEKQYRERAIAESKRLGSTGTEFGEAATFWNMVGMEQPGISRRMTAARTGQEASQALPLGLLPEYQLSGSGGARGAAERFLGMSATPEAMTMAAVGALAAPMMVETPAMGAALALAGLYPAGESAVKAVKSGKTADYGEALANLILFGGTSAIPLAGFGLKGMQAARSATAARMAAREAQIAAAQRRGAILSGGTKPSVDISTERVQPGGGSMNVPEAMIGPEPLPPGFEKVLPVVARDPRFERIPQDQLMPPYEAGRRALLPKPSGPPLPAREPVKPWFETTETQPQVPEPTTPAPATPQPTTIPSNNTVEAQLNAVTAAIQKLRKRGATVPREMIELERSLRKVASEQKKSDVASAQTEVLQPEAAPVAPPQEMPGAVIAPAQASELPGPAPEAAPTTAPAPTAPVQAPAPSVPAPEPAPSPVVKGIMQALQNAEKERLGVTGETPRPGSVSRTIQDDVNDIVRDPERQAAFLEQVRNTDFDNAGQVNGLDTRHQAAAYLRQQELEPLLTSPDPDVRRSANAEWFKMYQAIYRIGSKKGFELALQKLFNRVIDFGSPDATAKARAFVLDTMRNAGAKDDVAQAAVDKVMPVVERGIKETSDVRSREASAANLAEEVMATARASGRRITDETVMREYRARLAALGKTQLPSWAGQKSVLLAPVVREYRNGVRSLEAMKDLIKTKYGASLTDDEINDLMARAGMEFEKDNSRIREILRETHKVASREAWNSYSTGRKTLKTLERFQNLDRLITLGLDLGIFGTQFGLAAATRPAMAFAKLPSTARRGVGERIAASTVGGVPSVREMASKERAGGLASAFVKSLASEAGQSVAEQDIATLARMRYSEFSDPFAEAGLMGFQSGEAPGAGLARELSFAAEESIRGLPKGVRQVYTASQRATETGLRYGRALLFDQMMSPFEGLPRDDKMKAMRAVASFVNTLTGGPAYESKIIESAIGLLGHAQTAPRYYMSNLEMATGIPLVRTMLVGRGQGLSAKETVKLGRMVAVEYGRMAAMMMTMQGVLSQPAVQAALKRHGYDQVQIVSDPFDKDFGTLRYRVNQNSERTESLLGGRERYVPLILQTIAGHRTKRMAYGAPTQQEAISAGQRGTNVLQTMYGKSTFFPRTAVSMIPYSFPTESQYTGFNPLDAEFRSPGGGAFVPSRAGADIPMALSYLGQRIPMPLFIKEIVNLLPQYVRQGSSEEGKKAILKAQVTGMAQSSFGRLSRISPTPEIRNFVLNKQAIRKLPPDVRRKLEMDIMTEGVPDAVQKLPN